MAKAASTTPKDPKKATKQRVSTKKATENNIIPVVTTQTPEIEPEISIVNTIDSAENTQQPTENTTEHVVNIAEDVIANNLEPVNDVVPIANTTETPIVDKTGIENTPTETPVEVLPTVENESEPVKLRIAWTTHLNPKQNEYVESVYIARKNAGLTESRSDLLLQALDFAINHGYFTQHQGFALPEQHEYKLFHNGICLHFTNANKLPTI